MNVPQLVPHSIRWSNSLPSDVASGGAATPPRGTRATVFSTVAALWDALNQRILARQHGPNRPVYFNPAEVAVNETHVACLNNAHVLRVDTDGTGSATKPIHAHAVGIPPTATDTVVAATNIHYAAGQSPSASAYLDVVLQGVVSGYGIFQFVSSKAHHLPEASRETPIIGMLEKAIAARGTGDPLILGGRYEVTDFKPVAGKGIAGQQDDYLRYALTVIDHRGGTPPLTMTVPVTQAGLKFTDALLASRGIVRANDLLNEHQRAQHREHAAGATASVAEQLILSGAGFGRNATLITYRKICDRIADGSVTETNLMYVLHDEIDAGRQQRELKYVHSIAQLTELHAALQRRINDVSTPPTRHKRSHSFDFGSLDSTARSRIVDTGIRQTVERAQKQDEIPGIADTAHSAPQVDRAINVAADNSAALQTPVEELATPATTTTNGANEVSTAVVAPEPQPAPVTTERPSKMAQASHSFSRGAHRAMSGARSLLTGRLSREQVPAAVVIERTPTVVQTRQRSRPATPEIVGHADTASTNELDGIEVSNFVPRDVLDIGTVKSVITQEVFGKKIHRLGPGAVDTNYIDEMLNKVVRFNNTHLVKNISGAAANCWWRAAWILVLIKHAEVTRIPEAHLENILIQKLGPDCTNDAKKITQMVRAIREEGFYTVLTNMTHANLAADLESESRLKLPGMADEQGTIEAETICSSLTAQLLAQANVPYEIYGESVFGNEMGGDSLIAVLCSELQTDMVIFSRPWKDGKMDVEHSELAICTQPKGKFKLVEKSADTPQKLAEEIVNHALEGAAVIIHKGSHFNVSLPCESIWRCRYPT